MITKNLPWCELECNINEKKRCRSPLGMKEKHTLGMNYGETMRMTDRLMSEDSHDSHRYYLL